MDRKLTSIQVIADLRPIPGADKILCAKVLGWECVVKIGEFSVNDKCVFFEIDSVLPIAPWNAHLRKEPEKKLRIKTVRMKSQLSQGLALPISILPEGRYEVGDDVTSLLNVEKYELILSANLVGKVKGNFPSFLRKTDEERGQNVPNIIDELYQKKVKLLGTMKMDGTSFTAYRRNDEFGVCSRNLNLKETEDNVHWKMARKLKLEEVLRGERHNLCIQGEICGPGIQGNRMELKTNELYLFNLFDIDAGRYFNMLDLDIFCEKHKLTSVSLVDGMVFNSLYPGYTMDVLQGSADLLNYPNGTPAEGIVWRSADENIYSDILKGRMSFKTVSRRFLEKYKE